MGERTSHPPGTISWSDLGTTDPEAAKTFYSSLFGWEQNDLPIPSGGTYTMLRKDGRDAAALSAAQEGMPAFWNTYVTVESAADAAAKAAELGATVIAEPFDVMDAGRMAVIQDPTGAMFSVWEPGQSIGAEIVNAPGALTLSQLNTGDPDRAVEFYSALFGWDSEAMEGGPMPYWGFSLGGRLAGGMMLMPPGMEAPPHGLNYYGTESVDDAVERIGELGGQILIEPTEVPGGKILVAADPQGAIFGLWSGQYDD
jgi:predicted enzyme related to lactoylglutathione lyase